MTKKTALMALALSTILFVFSGAPAGAEKDNPFHPYPTPEERDREVYDLADKHPDMVEVGEYGKSVEGRPLLYIKISIGEKDKPAAWIAGNIHGNEWIGNRIVMGIAELLVNEYGKDELITRALDEMDFYLVPCINPDGYQKTYQNPVTAGEVAFAGATMTSSQEKSGDWGHIRKNSHSVDLNRNFPLPGKFVVPIDWAGSPDPQSVHYRGPEPLSEPETASIDEFFKEHEEIVAAISFHSFAGVQYPAHCPSHACMVRHKKMCKAFKKNQKSVKYPRLSTRIFDSYTGELEDWTYAEYGVLSLDIEISDKKHNKKACDCEDLFWMFNPKNPGFWVENDGRAAIAAVLEAKDQVGGKRIPRNQR